MRTTFLFHIGFEVFQQHALAIEKSGERTVRIELGEMTFENHPIKGGKRTNDTVLVYTQKCIHGLSVT